MSFHANLAYMGSHVFSHNLHLTYFFYEWDRLVFFLTNHNVRNTAQFNSAVPDFQVPLPVHNMSFLSMQT